MEDMKYTEALRKLFEVMEGRPDNFHIRLSLSIFLPYLHLLHLFNKIFV